MYWYHEHKDTHTQIQESTETTLHISIHVFSAPDLVHINSSTEPNKAGTRNILQRACLLGLHEQSVRILLANSLVPVPEIKEKVEVGSKDEITSSGEAV